MIWLASFPRSGNTFARNVLNDVYGLESSEFNSHNIHYPSTHDEFPIVKTHMRPSEVFPINEATPIILLVRDGRDALVSMAHHRSNIIEPGSDFNENLVMAVEAKKGSYFGGWAQNVREWLRIANIVIRFEDMIADPVREIERIRAVYPNLPNPNITHTPTFNSQKFGNPKYGPMNEDTKSFFHKGKIGDWQNSMSESLQQLFWKKSRDVMNALGYSKEGLITNLPGLEHAQQVITKEGLLQRLFNPSTKRPSANPLRMVSNHKIQITADWIYFKSVKGHDPLLQAIKSTVKNSNELVFISRQDGKACIVNKNARHITTNLNCTYLVSEVPLAELRSVADVTCTHHHFSWVKEPVAHICDLAITMKKSYNDTFITDPAHRNLMSRVISPFSNHIDAIFTALSSPQTILKYSGLSVRLNTNFAKSSVSAKVIDLILQYNRIDLNLYEHYLSLKDE